MKVANKLGLGARIAAILVVKGAAIAGKAVASTARDLKLGLQGKEIVEAKRPRKIKHTPQMDRALRVQDIRK